MRHDLTPVLAYFVGGRCRSGRRDLMALGWTLCTAAAVAAFGLVDLYAVPIEWWRDSGAVGFFRHQGYDYHGPGRPPRELRVQLQRGRLPAAHLAVPEPLGAAYLLGTALLAAAAGGPLLRRPWLLGGLCALWAAALLMTLSR